MASITAPTAARVHTCVFRKVSARQDTCTVPGRYGTCQSGLTLERNCDGKRAVTRSYLNASAMHRAPFSVPPRRHLPNPHLPILVRPHREPFQLPPGWVPTRVRHPQQRLHPASLPLPLPQSPKAAGTGSKQCSAAKTAKGRGATGAQARSQVGGGAVRTRINVSLHVARTFFGGAIGCDGCGGICIPGGGLSLISLQRNRPTVNIDATQ